MEERLKNLLKAIKLNESTISLILGIAVVLVVSGMIVNYFRQTPTQLPTIEDATVDGAVSEATESATTTASDSAVAQANTTTPTNKPTLPPTATPTLKPTATSTVAPTATHTPDPTATNAPSPTTASVTTNPTATTAPQPTATVQPTTVPTVAPTPVGQIASGVSTEASILKPNAATYTVQKGDNLWKIAETQYKTGYAWTDIAQANQLRNPGALNVGQTLNLPEVNKTYPVTTTVAQTQQPSAVNPISGDTYTVAAGDTLWQIAARAYNDNYQWQKIATANNIVDQHQLKIGMVLKLPR